MFAPDLILKTTPPRIPRNALLRPRLRAAWVALHERTAIALQAPAGFGKTTVLVQWRRQWLEQGALVAWLSADEHDDAPRFARGLLRALRTASGRAVFDALIAQSASQDAHDTDALTGMLAEVAGLGSETVLVIDDAERLPQATIDGALRYVLDNAPPNLHVLLGSRTRVALPTLDLIASGNLAVLGVEDLRLRLDETTALLHKRFGGRLGLHDATRLHAVTEGWPLGLQLVAATIEREPDLSAALAMLSARQGDIASWFIESLMARLPAPLSAFLVRVAFLEHLNADLCAAVTGDDDAADHLAQLLRHTPILVAGELHWYRLHALARDFLLGEFEQLPVDERVLLQRRAFDWFAARERWHEAAVHALAIGDEAAARAHAARALWVLGSQGHLAQARDWLERFPPEVLANDIELRLIAAWVMAFGDRNAAALQVAQRVLDDPGASDHARILATRVAAAAAVFADRVGLVAEITAHWPDFATRIEPGQRIVFQIPQSLLDLQRGDTVRARQRALPDADGGPQQTLPLALAFGRNIVALAHLWDGNAWRAESILQPALLAAEAQGGRRGFIACLHAAVLAAALLARDEPDAARALLANRLDVIERTGLPDSIALAYLTLAGVALHDGEERQALDLLDSLAQLADARDMPRLAMLAMAERIRIHAVRGRHDTATTLLDALAAMGAAFVDPSHAVFAPQFALAFAIAAAYTALARSDLAACAQQLDTAAALAASTHRARDAWTVQVLRAVLARRQQSAEALPLLAEARGLAGIGGYHRLLVDTHPLAVQMGTELRGKPPVSQAAWTDRRAPAQAAIAEASTAPRSALLTAKESEILALLAKGLSNKLIARAMGVGDETIKWHIKNLFLKLTAGTRKHAVDRARLLGLIAH